MFTFIKKLFTNKKEEEIEVTPLWSKKIGRWVEETGQTKTIVVYRHTTNEEEEVGEWWSNYASPIYGGIQYTAEIHISDLKQMSVAEMWDLPLGENNLDSPLLAGHDVALGWLHSTMISMDDYNVKYLCAWHWQIYLRSDKGREIVKNKRMTAMPMQSFITRSEA